MKRLFFIAIIVVMLSTFFVIQAFAQGEEWWEANRPETVYLTELAVADSIKFINEFEYPFILVLNQKEKAEYSNISSQHDRKFYIRDYLKSHNENPLLPINYWLLEFIARYEYARKEFALLEAPYIDVRGEFYIKYGKPHRRFEDKGGYKGSWFLNQIRHENIHRIDANNRKRNVLGLNYDVPKTMESGFKIKQNESWSYENNFVVHFAKEGKTWKQIDRLDKVLDDRRGSKLRLYWTELVKEREGLGGIYGLMSDEIEWMQELLLMELSQAEIGDIENITIDEKIEVNRPTFITNNVLSFVPGGPVDRLKRKGESIVKSYLARAVPNVSSRFSELSKFEIDYNISQFRNPDGRTRIDLQLLAPIDEMLKQRPNVTAPDSVKVDFQFLIRNENFDNLLNVPVSTSFDYKKSLDARLPYAVSGVVFPAEPMIGDLTFQVTDPVSMNRGYKKVPFNVRNFSGDSLMVSDIQLYMQPQNIFQKELLPITKVGQIEITPYPYKEVISNMPITCFFEIYNIQKSGIVTAYDIDISVTRLELSLFERLKKLIKDTKNYTMGLNRVRQVESNDSSELIEFDISILKKGKYVLEVVVTDSDNKRTTARASKKIDVKKF